MVARTDAGMFALWQAGAFASEADAKLWEEDFNEPGALEASIREGILVPINLGIDGAFKFVVRVCDDIASLSERERKFAAFQSDPYRVLSKGELRLGAIDSIGIGGGEDLMIVPVAPGAYQVRVCLIDWMSEPGAEVDGAPAPDALPDFVVSIAPAPANLKYRLSIETFDRPDS
ncbi:hypothetical protein Slu03_30240 [Sediminihabitans luteus]|nr:hypothetical protein Slu03_30240 [Sediminihabitans luteus]